MNTRHRILVSLTLAVLCVAVATAQDAAAPARPAEPPPIRVDTALAVHADFAPMHWAPGSIASRDDARVAAEIGGRVVAIAEVGTELRRGDILARLDDAALRLRERQAQADLSRLQAQLDYSRRQEERYSALVRNAGISGAQLDQVVAERRVREQDLASARVSLEQARLQLRQATVRAPFDGVVVERSVQAGEFLAVGAPVARLVNTGSLEVRSRAPVAIAAHLREGTPVTLREGGQLSGQVLTTLVPVGDEASRQVELRIALAPAGAGEAARLIGTAVQVGVPSDVPRQVVAVPRDALVMREAGSHVMRINSADAAERVPVEEGAVQGDLVEVLGAVRPGDRLVVRGGERLQPGQRVSEAGRPKTATVAVFSASGN